ncbi:uncharacterized protein M6B38_250495 [Iris pallida]|uniref:Uncharacterized protein n=1 Tax=Iris pallida TaxID=29817 RepID=A0AAX6IKP2_IRIPA|nr:uncharacterized protein M6B38_250495 [Iris pallida]
MEVVRRWGLRFYRSYLLFIYIVEQGELGGLLRLGRELARVWLISLSRLNMNVLQLLWAAEFGIGTLGSVGCVKLGLLWFCFLHDYPYNHQVMPDKPA